MTPEQLARVLPDCALAFRGYNVTNLGLSRKLIEVPAYAPTIERHLADLSQAAAELLHRPVDLIGRVRRGEETSLETYGEAVTLSVAMELAHLDLLREHFGIDYHLAKYSFGYSLGEITALVAGGVIEAGPALTIPLSLAEDCAALAHDVTLGILFTRSSELPLAGVRRACLRINQQGRGIVAISTYLAPNSVLLLGQGDTLDRFLALAPEEIPVRFHLRKNEHRWPPLHTPIVSNRHIADRAAQLMHTLPIKLAVPKPNVLSLVTGQFTYHDTSARKMLHEWVDHPQLVWNAIEQALAEGIRLVINVGPEPNLIPATFRRVSDNVKSQLKVSVGLRALSAAARRPWLQRMLPQRAALLRAPFVEQLILEEWLLDHAPGRERASG
jgi:[acyl-carrier-protein] S-malonyltransferase